MTIKSWPKLLISIVVAQSAGLIGSFSTISAIPNWYASLNRPVFSPPNWVFGPVWTILYTLIGIALYKIWIKNKKGSLNLFFFHLFLNAIWSPIFFGLHNLILAFLVIILMDISLIIIIKKFYKIDKIAAYLLIFYLLWISFASVLNFSFWQLNKENLVKNIFAQDFTFNKAREDYVFTEDNYKKDLNDFNLKKASYQKNPTLSLKEELRTSLYKFIGSRNDLVKNYLTMLRMKGLESVNAKIDPEVVWYQNKKNSYSVNDSLEDILSKSKEEDAYYETDTLLVIYFALSNISLNQVKTIKEDHLKLYKNLKSESEELIKLGRADASLFDRWFKDIDQELDRISIIEKDTLTQIEKITGSDEYQRNNGYKKAIETLDPAKTNLLKLNGFIKELENVIASKR
ncbi:MAG: TspO/MBR family protein [Candidatus Woesearchaeota archaeon]|jgi:tryptophan-rich sensory protein